MRGCIGGGTWWKGGDHKACVGNSVAFGRFRWLGWDVEGVWLPGECLAMVRIFVYLALIRVCVGYA